jgi:2'-5' RNA ligase
MHSVFSLLDNKHYQLVEDLRAELARKFAVREFNGTSHPHITYQVAGRYNVKSIEAVLQRFAASKASFKVRTSGLGIFTGPNPVLHLRVVRSPELTQFHEVLWQEISRTGSDFWDYYHPANWMPHITIGMNDMNKDNLSQIVPFLAERDFCWEMTVDNITLGYNRFVPLFGKKIFFGARISIYSLQEGDARIMIDRQIAAHTAQFMPETQFATDLAKTGI